MNAQSKKWRRGVEAKVVSRGAALDAEIDYGASSSAEHPSEAAMSMGATLRKNPRLIPHVPSRPRVHLRLVGSSSLSPYHV